jgi:hypothetical protein
MPPSAGFVLGLLFVTEYGDDMFPETSGCLRTLRRYNPRDRTLPIFTQKFRRYQEPG